MTETEIAHSLRDLSLPSKYCQVHLSAIDLQHPAPPLEQPDICVSIRQAGS